MAAFVVNFNMSPKDVDEMRLDDIAWWITKIDKLKKLQSK